MTDEFDCCECGRHIIVVVGVIPDRLSLCAVCISMPGWFRDPRLREILDADHDGLEVCEREASDGRL